MDSLTPEEKFIEDFGIFLESLGFSRIAGRIIGLLLVKGEAMHLDQIASTLKVSRASISTNTRTLVAVQFLKEQALPGDRRTWFVVSPDAFMSRLDFMTLQFQAIQQLLSQGLAVVPEGRPVARARLGEAIEFHQFLISELQSALSRWHNRSGSGALPKEGS